MQRTIALLSITLASGIITAFLGIPYQLSQLVQQELFLQDEQVNLPFVPRPAYATGSLTNVFAIPSNNIVQSLSYYQIGFTPSTGSSPIKTIEITFPPGFDVTNAKSIHGPMETGLGVLGRPNCDISITGQTIVCEALPSIGGTASIMMIGDIKNGKTRNNQIAILTRDESGNVLDGPTNSATFSLTLITNGMLAENSVTYTKIDKNSIDSSKIKNDSIGKWDLSKLFLTTSSLADNETGNDKGWNPDGSKSQFVILDKSIQSNSNVLITLDDKGKNIGLPVKRPYTYASNSDGSVMYVLGVTQNQEFRRDSVYFLDGESDKVLKIKQFTAPKPDFLGDIEYNPNSNQLYVTYNNVTVGPRDDETQTGLLYVLDASTGDTLTIVDLPYGPTSMKFNPVTDRLYVGLMPDTNAYVGKVAVIDASSNDVLTYIDTGLLISYSMGLNPVTNKLYLGMMPNGTHALVAAVDGETNSIEDTISLGNMLNDFAVDPITNTLYVSSYNPNKVFVMDGQSLTVLTTINVPEAQMMEIDLATHKLYVGRGANPLDSIEVIDTETNGSVTTIKTDGSLERIGFNPHKNKLYLSDVGKNRILIVDTLTNRILEVFDAIPSICGTYDLKASSEFRIQCSSPPTNGSTLNYVRIN